MSYRLLLLLILCFSVYGCTSFQEVIADGPYEEDYGIRTRGMELEDRDIQSKIHINARFEQSLANARVQANSFNRNVLLTGQVANQNARQQATKIASETRHVREVFNELEVGEPIGFITRNSDRLLRTRVRSRLMAAANIESGRVEIIVENGTVYFMGLVTRAEANRIVEAAKQASGISKIVKVFEYID